jgi:putative ABC transport system permease protein
MLRNYLLPAWRSLTRNKIYALINLSGLAIGICACIMIYIVAGYEFSFDDFHPAGNRIYRIGGRLMEDVGTPFASEGYGVHIPAPAIAACRQEIPGIEAIAGFYPYPADVTVPVRSGPVAALRQFLHTPGKSQPAAIITDTAYFSIFHYDWLAGNPATALLNSFSVVLTASQARKYFGPDNPAAWLGRELIYDDSLHVHVTGILQDWSRPTDFPYTDFISSATISASFLQKDHQTDSWHFNPRNQMVMAVARLAENASSRQLNPLLAALSIRHMGNDPFLSSIHFTILAQPLSDIHFNSAYNYDGIHKANRPALYALIATAIFILLIAIVNVINLSTAQSAQRSKEIAMHKILGSGKTRIRIRFLLETAILTLLAAAIGLLLVRPALAALHGYLPDTLPHNLLSPATALFTLAVATLTTLLAGGYPAGILAAMPPMINGQHPGTRSATGKALIRKSLIVFQFTISLVFIIASFITSRQIAFMLDSNPGFNKDAIIILRPDDATRMRTLAKELRRLPSIADLTLQGHAPIGAAIIDMPVQYEGRKDRELRVSILAVDDRFLPTYQMKLLAGHNIRRGDSANEFLINATYARALGFQHPGQALGKFLTLNGQSRPIVGVVADFHTSSFQQSIGPILMSHIPDIEGGMGIRLISTGGRISDLTTTLAQIAAQWKKINPDVPFDYSFLDQNIAALYHQDRQLTWLIDAAMLLTITIACMGLVGLILFVVEKRRKEIAVRKVLGADVLNIVALLNGEIITLVTIALLIASPLAWYGTRRWLQDFAYRIPMPWWLFPLAGLVAVTIASLTISTQVIRAAIANPIKSLSSQ